MSSEDTILDPSTQGTGDESARRRRANRGGAGAGGASGAGGAKSSSATLFTKLVDAQSDESTWKVSGANFMWVPCSNVEEGKAFEVGEVKERKGKEIVVETESGEKKTFPIEEVFPMNPPKLTGIEDMARLSHLNEPSVLFNLKKRYDNDKIYTYSGLFLVAVNPYKNLPIYTDEVIKKHQGKRREDAEPHVFTVSDVAYRYVVVVVVIKIDHQCSLIVIHIFSYFMPRFILHTDKCYKINSIRACWSLVSLVQVKLRIPKRSFNISHPLLVLLMVLVNWNNNCCKPIPCWKPLVMPRPFVTTTLLVSVNSLKSISM